MTESGRALSRWTEVVGVVGVILSLVFVGVEISQNTQALRGATYQALAESEHDTPLLCRREPRGRR